MKKKTITITASASVIRALGLVLIPVNIQKTYSEKIYLKSMKQTVSICLS